MRSRTSPLSRLAFLVSVVAALTVGLVAPGRWSAAQEPNELAGDYAVSIGSNDIPTDLAGGSIMVGRWHVAFQADGSYYAERLDIGRVVSGTWELDGDTLTVTDVEGLVSCSNATAMTGDQGDVSTGRYSVVVDEDILALTPAEEGCRTRAVLFGTRDFGQFVACLTNAPAADVSPVAEPEASPVPDDELSESRGESNDGGLFDLLTPTSGQADEDAGADEEATDDQAAEDENAQEDSGDVNQAAVDAEIDDLLAQMTACWSTQDAEQFLPLLTEDFRDTFLGAGTEEEQTAEIEELMIQPLVWERAGDIDVNDDEATVVVRLSIAGADQFLTYRFLLGEDGWQWDGQE